MKSDLSRDTFSRAKRYTSVRLQQGRVQLDSDWNEQTDIVNSRIETESVDLIGFCGTPADSTGNSTGFQVIAVSNSLTIGRGRLYVDGLFCENDTADLAINAQPDPPAPSTFTPAGAGIYLAYLDAWRRNITAIEDPKIREVALGGPDTATRIKTIWQVKLLQVGKIGDNINCLTDSPAWNSLIAGSTGTLTADVDAPKVSPDPCEIPATAGYRGLENQLYRVEIHEINGSGSVVSLKWSRDNGSVVSAIDKITPADKTLTVRDVGRDTVLGFAKDQYVEITDDSLDLAGKVGQITKITDVDPVHKLLTLADAPTLGFNAALHPKVRRWESVQKLTGSIVTYPVDAVTFTAGAATPIEQGINVTLTAGSFHMGDYWLIPARTALGDTQTGDIEWPRDTASPPKSLPHLPLGGHHHFCRLAVTAFDGTKFALLQDCRRIFPPITALKNFFYLGGDSQENFPGETLPIPLQTGVTNGQYPVQNAMIQYTAANGVLKLNAADATGPAILTVPTDATGVAKVFWQPDPNGPVSQQTTARLLDAASNPMHLPIDFNAQLNLAKQVFYDPKACSDLKGVNNVQDALDKLCNTREPGIVVRDILIGTSGTSLKLGDEVTVDQLAQGIRIICDQPLDPATLDGMPLSPSCYVSLDNPHFIVPQNQAGLGNAFTLILRFLAGFNPLILSASVSAKENEIAWHTVSGSQVFLQQELPNSLAALRFQPEAKPRTLAWLILKGNFILSRDGTLNLDGEIFNSGTSRPTLPSGDNRRGGDLEFWFWVKPAPTLQVKGVRIIGGGPNSPVVSLSNPPSIMHYPMAQKPHRIEVEFTMPVDPASVQPFNPNPPTTFTNFVFPFGVYRSGNPRTHVNGTVGLVNETTAFFEGIIDTGQYEIELLGGNVATDPSVKGIDKKRLDGDPIQLPSGNGLEGGNFNAQLSIDANG